MNIEITRHGAPTIPDEITDELLEMDPKVFMIWNPCWRAAGKSRQGKTIWEPRWEIWCELRQSSHEDATNTLSKNDRWNPDHKCWMRRLQTYKNADGSFAPVDRRLIVGLRMADAWEPGTDEFYQEHILDPEARRERALQRQIEEAAGAGARYYNKIDSPIVGRHANSGWRWRVR